MNLNRARRTQARQNIKLGFIHEDHLNAIPTFGTGEGTRGIPTLRWDNAVSREMFKFRDDEGPGSIKANDSLDSLNANYRLTISPLPKVKKKGSGLISIVSADTHIALNSVKGPNRPTTQSALDYNSSVDTRGDPRIRRDVELDEETKKQLKATEDEIRDGETEKWLLTRKRYPEFRWTVKQKRALRKWFDHLDDDRSGEVDVDELADPLLSTGIAGTISEVKALIRTVDKDGSGEIGFEEFLKVMQPKKEPGAGTTFKTEVSSSSKGGGGGGLGDNNPIAQLQKIQHDNGDIDMKVVVAMQRRKFLMNAVVGEMKRREATLEQISEMEAEAKLLKGKSKFKLIHDIKTKVNAMNKSYSKRQQFVSSMKGMIDKANAVQMTALQQFQAEMQKDDGRSLTLTEAIDEFGKDFDLKRLRKKKANNMRGRNVESIEDIEAQAKMPALRGVTSRQGDGGAGSEAGFWYKNSSLKVKEEQGKKKKHSIFHGKGGRLAM
ncbi:hypothetical protein TrST_g7200 [Triparma strigata]|uniref:EF-hand domain-containing protein n=1 Tax=Triparma strigata TaxID=1606541 RepID=A0A9W6ZUE5_9STRA|nr:hypothetical protein TrST_g7200 [Triparma strigata]